MNSNNSTRIEWIDLAKAFAIAFVVLDHCFADDTLAKMFTMSFTMPLFFLLHGMTIKESKYESIRAILAVVKKSFFTQIVPFVIWGLIYSQFSLKNVLLVLYGTRETLGSAGSLTSLWFLPTMFCSEIFSLLLLYAVRKIKKDAVRTGMLVLLAAVFIACGCSIPHSIIKWGVPFGCDIAIVGTAYSILGFVLKKGSWISKQNFFVSSGISLLSLLALCFTFSRNRTSVGYVLMGSGIYGNVLLFALNAILGSLFVIFLAVSVSKLKAGKAGLLWLGRNTLGIFILHKPIVRTFRAFLDGMGYSFYLWYVVLGIYIVGFLLSILGTIIINKIAPFLFGKKSSREVKNAAA